MSVVSFHGCVWPQRRSLGVTSPSVGIFAYTCYDGTSVSVHAVPLDGSAQGSQVTAGSGSTPEFSPVASPDGSKIAFLRRVSTDNYDLYVIDADGSNETLLDNSGDIRYPQWHPDSSSIIYRDGNDIRTINADGTGAAVIDTVTNNRKAKYSADGAYIAYMVEASPNVLWVMDADGTNNTNLTNMYTGGLSGIDFAWANTQNALVFTDYPNHDVKIINADGTGLTTIEASAVAYPTASRVAWSADDSAVYVVETDTVPWGVWEVQTDGGGSTAVGIVPQAASQRGGAYVVNDRIYTVRVDGANYDFASFALDGSDERIEDDTNPNTNGFDITLDSNLY